MENIRSCQLSRLAIACFFGGLILPLLLAREREMGDPPDLLAIAVHLALIGAAILLAGLSWRKRASRILISTLVALAGIAATVGVVRLMI